MANNNDQSRLILCSLLLNGCTLETLPIPQERAKSIMNEGTGASKDEASKLLHAYMRENRGQQPYW